MPKVLLVEDNAENRDALSRRLQRRGYDVIIATDGKQGVAMVQAEAPDLILLDIGLPEMDGWEVARTLEASEATRHIPVIALTAHAMPGDREKALSAGCDDYDTKPVEFDRLLGKIQARLAAKDASLALSAADLPVLAAARARMLAAPDQDADVARLVG